MWFQSYEEIANSTFAERFDKKIISCEENNCKYVANNIDGDDIVHIQPDKDIAPEYDQDKRIDHLLLNETKKTAYLIELKSSNLEKAILQLKNTYQKLSKILVGYKKFFRVVYNSKTSNLVMNKCKKT